MFKDSMTLKQWMSLIGLTCAAFIFNTSEFIPIGLLSDIAEDFSVTEAKAGMIISVYAFVVMLVSLPLMIFASKFDLKKLIISDGVPAAVGRVFRLRHAHDVKNRSGVRTFHLLVHSVTFGCAHGAREVQEYGVEHDCRGYFGGNDIRTSHRTYDRSVHRMAHDVPVYRHILVCSHAVSHAGVAQDTEPRALLCQETACAVQKSHADKSVCPVVRNSHIILHGIQLHRTVHETGGRNVRQSDYDDAYDIRRNGNSRQSGFLKTVFHIHLPFHQCRHNLRCRMSYAVEAFGVQQRYGHTAMLCVGHHFHGV